MEFNVGDLVHVQSFGKGIIIEKKQDYKETVTTIYLVRLIDRDKDLWFCSDSLIFASKGEVEEIMAGIHNKYVNTKVVAPNKETGTYEPYVNCKAVYKNTEVLPNSVELYRYTDAFYQKVLEDAKKRLNSMHGFVGYSFVPIVLKHDIARFLNEVKDIKFSGPATIVFWKDGTKTIVKCQEGEHYDPKEGIKYALLKKLAGGTSNQASKKMKAFDEWLEKWIPEDLKEDTKPGDNLDYESEIYITEEMKKRLIGMGKGLNELTDKLHSVNEKLRGFLDDKPEETEKK